MEARPRLKIELDKVDIALEILGWLLIFYFWIMIIANYQILPDVIPTHYNAAGEPDRFGQKWIILTLPAIATVIFIVITILNKFPHVFNYPTKITADNALSQYTFATKLMRYLKVIIVVVFGMLAYQTIRYANQQTDGLGTWFLPIVVSLTFVPLILFLFKSLKSK